MGWIKDLFLGPTETDFSQNGHGPKFGVEVDPAFLQGDAVGLRYDSTRRVQRDDALAVPAVLRARNIIAGTLGGLPIHIRNKNLQIESPTNLLDQIDPDVPNVVTWAQTYEDLFFESISWWRILEFGWHNYPTFARHVPIERVHASPTGVYIDGKLVPDDQVVRFDSPNPPLLKHGARAIRTALRLDATAKLYADSPTSLGHFSPKEGVPDLEEEQIEELLSKYEQSRRSHAYGYVGAAWELQKLGYTAEEIQLMDQRQHAVLEIARATGIDPEDLGVSTTSRTYQNAETRRQDTTLFTFGAYINAVEQRLSMRDIIPRGYRAKVNLNAYLRPDTKTRYQTHAIGIKAGFLTEDEARDLEDLPPLTDTQKAEMQPRETPLQEELETND